MCKLGMASVNSACHRGAVLSAKKMDRRKAISMALIIICGAGTGVSARLVVDWYRENYGTPVGDDPVLHGRLKMKLAVVDE